LKINPARRRWLALEMISAEDQPRACMIRCAKHAFSMVSLASGSTTMAEAGIPCASAVLAITSASTKRLCAAPPLRISRGATPRSYSRTASVTRANWVGVGLPSASAGAPSTMIASKRLRVVLPDGASCRASTAHANRSATSRAAPRTKRNAQFRRSCFPILVRCTRLRFGIAVGVRLSVKQPSSRFHSKLETGGTPVRAAAQS